MTRIGVTETMQSEHNFHNYLSWLRSGGPDIECTRLSYFGGSTLEGCSGLVLTGGHDVNPRFYGGPAGHPTITEIDPRRDEFEKELIEGALSLEIPVLGICRGLQLANVHFGGTLIPDLEESGFPSHRSTTDGAEHRHPLTVVEGSGLSVYAESGTVNSSHHQGIDRIGKGLRAAAFSPDGLPEALEREGGAFFLLVQWHPERMPGEPLASRILSKFLSTVRENVLADKGRQ